MNKIDHIAIQVTNLVESVEWYVKNFDSKILYSDDTWAMLLIGDTKVALTLPEQHPPHIAIEVSDLSEFPCNNSEIKEHRDGSKYLYVNDPSGNIIEYIYYPQRRAQPPDEKFYIHLP